MSKTHTPPRYLSAPATRAQRMYLQASVLLWPPMPGNGHCRVSFWPLEPVGPQSRCCYQPIPARETPGAAGAGGPSQARTTVRSLGNPTRLAGSWAGLAEATQRLILLLIHIPKRRAEMSLKEDISLPRLPPLLIPSSILLSLPFRCQLFPADKNTPQLPVCIARLQPAGSKCRRSQSNSRRPRGVNDIFFNQENPCLLLTLRRKSTGEGGGCDRSGSIGCRERLLLRCMNRAQFGKIIPQTITKAQNDRHSLYFQTILGHCILIREKSSSYRLEKSVPKGGEVEVPLSAQKPTGEGESQGPEIGPMKKDTQSQIALLSELSGQV